MIRRYLRDLINEHNPTEELNNNNNDNNNNNNNNNNRAEWKIQFICILNVVLLKVLKIDALCPQKVNQQKFLWVVIQMISLINFLIHITNIKKSQEISNE